MSTFTTRVISIEGNPADHGKKRYTIVVEYASSISTNLQDQITEGEDLSIELPTQSPPG